MIYVGASFGSGCDSGEVLNNLRLHEKAFGRTGFRLAIRHG